MSYIRTPEIREKMRAAAHAAYARDPEIIERLSRAFAGKPRAPFTDETRERMRRVNTGRHHTPQARAKMSRSAKRRGTPWLIHPDRELIRTRAKMRRFMHDCVFRVVNGLVKRDTTSRALLGYTTAELIAHLEARWMPGMTWGNYGDLWQIDHIRPIASFAKAGVSDPKVVNALGNLQPLWSVENRKKWATFNEKAG